MDQIISDSDISEETLQARREWNDVFQILKQKIFKPRIIYSAKLLFVFKNETNHSHTNKTLKISKTLTQPSKRYSKFR